MRRSCCRSSGRWRAWWCATGMRRWRRCRRRPPPAAGPRRCSCPSSSSRSACRSTGFRSVSWVRQPPAVVQPFNSTLACMPDVLQAFEMPLYESGEPRMTFSEWCRPDTRHAWSCSCPTTPQRSTSISTSEPRPMISLGMAAAVCKRLLCESHIIRRLMALPCSHLYTHSPT